MYILLKKHCLNKTGPVFRLLEESSPLQWYNLFPKDGNDMIIIKSLSLFTNGNVSKKDSHIHLTHNQFEK